MPPMKSSICAVAEQFAARKLIGASSMQIRTHLLLLATPFLLPALLPTLLHAQVATVPSGQAPVWVMVAAESQAVSVVLPAGTTYRFGDTTNNVWSAPITVTEPTTFSPVFYPAGAFPFSDPDPGVAKELDVVETSAAQVVTVTNTSVSPATTVAQIVPGFAVPTSVPVTPGTAYTVTFSNFVIAPETSGVRKCAAVSGEQCVAGHADEYDDRWGDAGLQQWARIDRPGACSDLHGAGSGYSIRKRQRD
jgi:hypothetical protein